MISQHLILFIGHQQRLILFSDDIFLYSSFNSFSTLYHPKNHAYVPFFSKRMTHKMAWHFY